MTKTTNETPEKVTYSPPYDVFKHEPTPDEGILAAMQKMADDFKVQQEATVAEALERARVQADKIIADAQAVGAGDAEARKRSAIAKAHKKRENQRLLNTKVFIELFKDDGKYVNDVTPSINGKTTILQRGVQILVPLAVALVLAHSKKQHRLAMEYIHEQQHRMKDNAANAGIKLN